MAGLRAFDFEQASASATWTITHNLGVKPAVSVFLSDGVVVMPLNIVHTSDSVLTVTFSEARSGSARVWGSLAQLRQSGAGSVDDGSIATDTVTFYDDYSFGANLSSRMPIVGGAYSTVSVFPPNDYVFGTDYQLIDGHMVFTRSWPEVIYVVDPPDFPDYARVTMGSAINHTGSFDLTVVAQWSTISPTMYIGAWNNVDASSFSLNLLYAGNGDNSDYGGVYVRADAYGAETGEKLTGSYLLSEAQLQPNVDHTIVLRVRDMTIEVTWDGAPIPFASPTVETFTFGTVENFELQWQGVDSPTPSSQPTYVGVKSIELKRVS